MIPAPATPFTDWFLGSRKGPRPEPTDEDRRLGAIRAAKNAAEAAERAAKRAAEEAEEATVLAAVAADLAAWLPGQGERWGIVVSPSDTYPGQNNTYLVVGLPAKALADAESQRITDMEAKEAKNAGRFVDLGHLRGRGTHNYFLCQSMNGWGVGNRDGRQQADRSPCYQTATEAVQWFTQHRGGPRDVLRIAAWEASKWSKVGGC